MIPYQVCELVLGSDIPLQELVRADDKPVQCRFLLLDAPSPAPATCPWIRQWHYPNGDLWLSFARLGSDYFLRFPEYADFLITSDGSEIRCHPAKKDIPQETLRHLLLDQVIPLLLSLRADLVLHGSAVLLPAGAIAFLGSSGHGKSTLAATFSTQNYPLLTDDFLVVKEKDERFMATPSYPGLRLWDDVPTEIFGSVPELRPVAHYTVKKRFGPDNGRLPFASSPAPLAAAFVLASPEEDQNQTQVRLTRLSLRESFMELVKHAYLLRASDRGRLEAGFEFVGRVVARLPVHRLSYPRDFSRLGEVRETILAAVKDVGRS